MSNLKKICRELFKRYGNMSCPLLHDTPFQLLVAVVLSAQCKDERVNLVTRSLFRQAPDAKSLAEMPLSELEKAIHSIGLFRNKAANLSATARILVEQYNGLVPASMEELVRLPGVGRKSANVILGNAFQIPGFPVDTHVKRVLRRLGETASDDPVKIEREITSVLPAREWTNTSHMLIQFGRDICHARNPECISCPFLKFCPSAVKNEL